MTLSLFGRPLNIKLQMLQIFLLFLMMQRFCDEYTTDLSMTWKIRTRRHKMALCEISATLMSK